MSSRTTEWYLKSYENMMTAMRQQSELGKAVGKVVGVKAKKLMSKDYGADKFLK